MWSPPRLKDTEISNSTRERNYDRAAFFYEKAAKIYSTNQIRASKRHQIQFISPNDKVLYLGAGTGDDAVEAARKGAHVSCLDISPKMLDRVRQKFEREGLSVDLICMNAFDFDGHREFDVVCANYFLNVFEEAEMMEILGFSVSFVRPGGYYLIADVARSQGNPLARIFNILYLKLAMVIYWVMGLVSLHKNYDYPSYFAEVGLELDEVEYFRFAKIGPVLFQSIVATRVE